MMPTKNLWLYPAMVVAGLLLMGFAFIQPGGLRLMSPLSAASFAVGMPTFLTGLTIWLILLLKRR